MFSSFHVFKFSSFQVFMFSSFHVFKFSCFQVSGRNMASIVRFEEIGAWEKSRELTRQIYAITNGGKLSRDYGLRDQIRRASASIMSNIAEGFERGSNKEFVQFLFIAKGSAGEVRAQLYIALDQGYIDPPQFESLTKLTVEICRMISGLITYLVSAKKPG
jgi:four helix bundle protein